MTGLRTQTGYQPVQIGSGLDDNAFGVGYNYQPQIQQPPEYNIAQSIIDGSYNPNKLTQNTPDLGSSQNLGGNQGNGGLFSGNPFGKGGYIPGIAQGLTSVANAYTGYKSLGLAQDQFAFNKKLALANLNNSAVTTNQALRDRQRVVLSQQADGKKINNINGKLDNYIKTKGVKGTL